MPTEDFKAASGFILINKPPGPTSHDIVDRLREITGIKKIGHAGTLDPFASGLLIMAVGREATRQIADFVKMDKEYIATLYLGAVSDTHDRTGKISKSQITNHKSQINSKFQIPNNMQVKDVLNSFIGRQLQVPPMYSAKKIGGKKLYELARKGVEVKREPIKIDIHGIEVVEYSWPLLVIKVNCSSGTYVRSLAHDIGSKLSTGAYLEALERTRIGGFSLQNASAISAVDRNNWKSLLFNAFGQAHAEF